MEFYAWSYSWLAVLTAFIAKNKRKLRMRIEIGNLFTFKRKLWRNKTLWSRNGTPQYVLSVWSKLSSLDPSSFVTQRFLFLWVCFFCVFPFWNILTVFAYTYSNTRYYSKTLLTQAHYNLSRTKFLTLWYFFKKKATSGDTLSREKKKNKIWLFDL